MLPEIGDKKWRDLVTGKIRHNFKALPAALLISRLTRKGQLNRTEAQIQKNIQEAYEFFEKYQNVFLDDLQALFSPDAYMVLETVQNAAMRIKSGKCLWIAAEEELLRMLPKGNWIGGTIPYFMDKSGGLTTKDKVSVIELPDFIKIRSIRWYDDATLPEITKDAPQNGFTMIILPAASRVLSSFAQNAAAYEGIFLKPLVGWVSGTDLSEIGVKTPKTVNGQTLEFSEQKAVACHCLLPEDKVATIGIINIFEPGQGEVLTFPDEGFWVKNCLVDGQKMNFTDYLKVSGVDTRLPLVANYSGAMINVGIQEIKWTDKTVHFFAPVFQGVEYQFAQPIHNYVEEFEKALPRQGVKPVFSCNCVLNYRYSELEGKKTAHLLGPFTFGEIAYQLMNQTLVYLEIQDLEIKRR